MKKALVLSLFVMLGVGVACSAQIQGEWDTYLKLNISSFGLESFYSFLDVQYLVGGWTLEAATIVDETGISQLWFEGFGSLGAFSMWSLAVFDPTPSAPAFTSFENGAEVSIAGVDLYALFAIQHPDDGTGSGFAFGGIGTAGDIRIGAEITFNLRPNLWLPYPYWAGIWNYGLNGWVTDWTYTHGCEIWNPEWYVGALAIIQTNCDVVFSYITGVAEFPICCADVLVAVQFTCNGFAWLEVFAKNINIGLDWLKVSYLDIIYTLADKDANIYFSVVTGDVVCFKPYWTVMRSGSEIQGIRLNALTLTCTLGGCDFYWGHIFADPALWTYHFAPTGLQVLSSTYSDCWWTVVDGQTTLYPNEMFGVSCDEDSCCGGLFSFSVNNFFNTTDTTATGIFGWMGTYAQLTVGVGSNISLVGAMDLTALHGVEWIVFGVNVAF